MSKGYTARVVQWLYDYDHASGRQWEGFKSRGVSQHGGDKAALAPHAHHFRRRPAAGYIYQMIKARKAYRDKMILDDVSMSFLSGTKINTVGLNGVDGPSILKIMAGFDEPNDGEARLTAEYVVSILEQEPKLNEPKTMIGNVYTGAGEIYSKPQRFNEISEETVNPDVDFDSLMEEMGTLQDTLDAASVRDISSQLRQAVDVLRYPSVDQPVSVLPGGGHRHVALCRLLIEAPDLFFLDEPTNHLDAESML